ncbi:MAG: hypothetical protein U0L09_05495 [Christensenellales bacterium]|nr:hypothetical protein [Christensenellales bacterium]
MNNNRGCAVQVVLSGAFAAACSLVALFLPLYRWIDNYGIAMMVGGIFGEDRSCMYLHPLFCRWIGWLSGILPSADVFSLVSRLLVGLAIWTTSYLILRSNRSVVFRATAHMGLTAVVFLMELYSANYTVWTSFFCCVGGLCLSAAMRKDGGSAGRRALGCGFVFAACLYRIQGVLVCLPFLLLDMGLRALEAPGERLNRRFVRYCSAAAPALGIVLIMGLTMAQTYCFGEYAREYAYNEARMSVVDYPMMEYEDLAQIPEGVSRNDYECVRHWILMDTDVVTTGYMEAIYEAGGVRGSLTDLRGNLSMLAEVVTGSWRDVLLTGLALASALAVFLKRGWNPKLRAGLSVLGALMIAWYFAALGRFPERVMYCILLGIMTCILSGELYCNGSGRRGVAMALSAVILASFFVAMPATVGSLGSLQSALTARTPGAAAQTDVEPEAMWIWDIGSSYASPMLADFVQGTGKLPSRETVNHHLVTGDVTYGQRVFREWMDRVRIDNPMKALLEREQTYVAAPEERMRYVLTWLEEHYDSAVEAVQEGTLNGTPVWRFVSSAG